MYALPTGTTHLSGDFNTGEVNLALLAWPCRWVYVCPRTFLDEILDWNWWSCDQRLLCYPPIEILILCYLCEGCDTLMWLAGLTLTEFSKRPCWKSDEINPRHISAFLRRRPPMQNWKPIPLRTIRGLKYWLRLRFVIRQWLPSYRWADLCALLSSHTKTGLNALLYYVYEYDSGQQSSLFARLCPVSLIQF